MNEIESKTQSERWKNILHNGIRSEVKHFNNSITHKKIMISNIFVSLLLSALYLRMEIWACTHDNIFSMQ